MHGENTAYLLSRKGFDNIWPQHYYYALMSNRVPKIIDPVALSVKRATIAGKLPLASLERLCGETAENSGEIDINIEFGTLEHLKRPNFEYQASVAISSSCERCGEQFTYIVNASSQVIIVRKAEDEKEFDDKYDIICTEDEEIDLYQIIEDELILSLPLVAKHENAADCETKFSFGDVPKEDTEKVNPFAELAKLKKH